jgi:mannosyltransferase
MKIILDNLIYFLQNSGGGSVYWTEIVKRLNDKNQDVYFVEPQALSNNNFRKEIDFKNLSIESKIPLSILRFLDFRQKINDKYIFHSSYYRVSNAKNAKNIVTIHDFTSEKYLTGLRRWVHYTRKKHALKKADGIICISQNTKKDLLEYHKFIDKNKIKIIYNGVGNQFFKLNESFDKHQFKYKEILEKKYILYVGHRTSYKNFDVAVKTISLLDKKFILVIIGEPLKVKEKAMLETISDRYTVKSGINTQDLNVIYNFAFCLLYPSSYEGFGIPILEAMKTHCPVVTTSMSSIPEVAGDAALLIDTIDPKLFAEEILKLENTDFRSNIISKGLLQAQKFSWDKCYNEVLEFYKEIYQK